jgi:hypothetical protein
MDELTMRRIWNKEKQTGLALFFGVIVWFLHLNVVYGLPSLACRWGWFSFTVAGLSGVQFVELLLTILAGVLLVGCIYLSWRDWRRFQTVKPPQNPRMLRETEHDRRPLIAFVTMLLNALFLLYVLGFILPILTLNPCGQA